MHTQCRLRELIQERGTKDVHVASHCDVHQSTVTRWAAGGTIPDEQKVRLAAYFEVPVGYLMGWDDPEHRAA